MEISRRRFLTGSGAAGTGALLGSLGLELGANVAQASTAAPRKGDVRKTICPYCAVGCGQIVEVAGGEVISIEGDPEHPINEGALCGKGAALRQIHADPAGRRARTVKHRKPGSREWAELSWSQALPMIAERIRDTRDRAWTGQRDGHTLNRADGIACLGGASLTTEECYLLAKAMRALGLVWIEHQARLCNSAATAALTATLGHGAMTNHWIDLANADVVMICGSNPAENHPIAARWLARARDSGAIILACDPRNTRTTAFADHYCRLRSGTDIAFVGGMINFALQSGRIHAEYVRHHTNATFIVGPDFAFDDGLFAGYDAESRTYDRAKWAFELDESGVPRRDMTMEHPRCVFQLLRQHFARYAPDTVCSITGADQDDYRRMCETYTSTCTPDRAGTWLGAAGAAQHTTGTQAVRACAILQLLLGNVGVAGGGVNALRGAANAQGASDMGLLFDTLPGYLPTPRVGQETLAEYLAAQTPRASGPNAVEYPKRIVSLLKAFWGGHATRDNDFCYSYLGKIDGDFSHTALFDAMRAGTIDGLLCFGENPAVSGPDAGQTRAALANLDWLVVVDPFETETATFWQRPGAEPANVGTEVFLLPAASSIEKEGSVVNSGRWAQWRHKAVAPIGRAQPDSWIITRLVQEVRQLYRRGGQCPEPIVNLAWDYRVDQAGQPDIQRVVAEINGYYTAGPREHQQVAGFKDLADDGGTCSGNWLYCGSYVDLDDATPFEKDREGSHITETRGRKTINRMAKRFRDDPEHVPSGRCVGLHPDWAWCWPMNTRVLHNRAALDPDGRPWDPRRWVTRWSPATGAWEGDVPDGDGPLSARGPFFMRPEGLAGLLTDALPDGPLPEHYEPLESPLVSPMSSRQNSPVIRILEPDKIGNAAEFPIVATTYRLCEHARAGAMSRNTPWLVELVPDVFVEMSPNLAKLKGIATGDWVVVRSARGELRARALVTGRLQSLRVGGQHVEQIGIPWHWGYSGLAAGDSANLLTPRVVDAGSLIPEYKAFLCAVEREEVS